MTEPAHTSPLPAVRLQWTLLQPLLAALSEAGVPLRPGDLDQLQHAAAIGPEFAHALARWLRAAHTAAAPAPLPTGVRTLAPRPERPALGPSAAAPVPASGPGARAAPASGPGPAAVADRHAS
ncbi:hypothetical protein [Kitasatospora fiedleri]|uniref:hypothetical protein n=1 Tax=Kitasatospora fiedleri TaxID=2991545 RepID=UPI00249BEC85|nr:hypothetical protein [Kitasatospora fiedleri]